MTVKNQQILELNQPLKLTTDRPIFRYDLEHQDYKKDEKLIDDIYYGNKIELASYQPIKFYSKQPEAKLTKWDVVKSPYIAMIVNNKIKAVFEAMCPRDVQFLPVIIEGKGDKAGIYQNHDYYIANILVVLDIFQEKVEIDGGSIKSYPYFRDLSAFHDHMIAIEKRYESRIFFHPILAKALAKFKGIDFLTEERLAEIL